MYKYDTFLGDSAFDKGNHYTFLKDTYKFSRVLIPLNPSNSSALPTVGYIEYGYPLCPNYDSLVSPFSSPKPNYAISIFL